MKILLLIAHGSRKVDANEEVIRLAEQIGAREPRGFDRVMPAFLEFAEPDIHRAVDHCVELGAERVVVVPYFLSAGNHVQRDIPAELACVAAKYPQLEIETAAYVGASPAMGDLVLQSAQAAVAAGD